MSVSHWIGTRIRCLILAFRCGGRIHLARMVRTAVAVWESQDGIGEMQKMRETVDRFTDLEHDLGAVASKLRCILHKVMEKFLERLVNECLARCDHATQNSQDQKTRAAMVQGVQTFLSANLFGTPSAPGKWQFPWNKDRTEKVNVDGLRAQRTLDCD